MQIMFISKNEKKAQQIAELAKDINPDEVQINTPLRPCACKPLSRRKIKNIAGLFSGLNVITVYDYKRKKIKPISKSAVLKRGRKY